MVGKRNGSVSALLLTVILLSIFFAATGGKTSESKAAAEAGYTNCKLIDNDSGFKLYWDVVSVPGTVKFLVEAETAGWLGLGLSNGGDHPMISNGNLSDIWLAWIDPDTTSVCNTGCLKDYWVAQYRRPTLDPPASQSLTLINANVSSQGVLTVEFSRELDTGDVAYDRVIDLNSPTTFIWALNPSVKAVPTPDGVTYPKHAPATKGTVTIDLSQPSICSFVPESSSNSYTSPDGTWKASWAIDNDDQTITITLAAATKGWVGIGFGTDPVMINADIYVGWITPAGVPVMTDRFGTAYAMPHEDTELGGTNNVVNVVTESDGNAGVTTITFTRALNTGDKHDMVLQPGTVSLLWAYGSDNSVNYDTNTFSAHIAKGTAQINLFNGCTTFGPPIPTSINLVKVHSMLMVIAICVIIFPGILLSRFFKNIIPKWFYMHAVMQTVGVACVIAGFVLVYVAKGKIFLIGWHQVFGLLVLIGFGMELIFGFISHFVYNPLRKAPPVFPDKVHWWFGKGVFLLAIITMFLGLRAYDAPLAAWILCSVWLCMAAVAAILLQLLVGQTHETYERIEDDSASLRLQEPGPYEGNGVCTKPVIILFTTVVLSVGLILVGFVTVMNEEGPPSDNLPVDFDLCLNFDSYVVPSTVSNYICKGFYVPSAVDYHITQFDAIKDNQEMLHHMILYETSELFDNAYFSCNPMPPGSSILFAWNVGMGSFATPPDVGFRVGKTGSKYLVLQIHYDNSNRWGNRTDSSGFRLSMTSKLRPIDAGLIQLGLQTSQINMTAKSPYIEYTGTCDTANVKSLFSSGVTVFSYGLHMHTLGRQLYTDQYRPVNGTLEKIGTIGCNDYYSFNTQGVTALNATIQPTDQFITHCAYDTSSKDTPVLGCETADCEMCINYLAYYPKISGSGDTQACFGTPVLSSNTARVLQC